MNFLSDFSGPSLVRRIALILALVQAIILLGFFLATPLLVETPDPTPEAAQQILITDLEREFVPLESGAADLPISITNRKGFEQANSKLSYVVQTADIERRFGDDPAFRSLPTLMTEEEDTCKSQRGTILRGNKKKVISFSQKSCGEKSYYIAVSGVQQTLTINTFENAVIFFWGVWVYWVVTAVLVGLVTLIVLALLFKRLQVAAQQADSLPPDKTIVRVSEHKLPVEVKPFVGAMNEMIGRLRDYYEKQQRFAAAAAHDLRTPLTIMRSRLEELKASKLRDRLIRDVERMSTSIAQILNLARLNAGEGRLGPVDLNRVAERVLESTAPGAFLANKSIELVKPDDPVVVLADDGAVYSAMCNLVFNAVEHAPGNTSIVVILQDTGSIDIVNSGAVISEADHKTIFKPYKRLGSNGNGHGMGLAIVSDIMELCGGTVTIADSGQEGTSFRLAFQLHLDDFSL